MNCSNCQNPIQEGEKFCGKCGSPLDVIPVANIQFSPQPGTGSKRTVFIVVGIVTLLAIVASSAFWLYVQGKDGLVTNDKNPVPQNNSSDVPVESAKNVAPIVSDTPAAGKASAEESSFVFSGTEFFFDPKSGALDKSGLTIYEFYPAGESASNWKQSVTIFRKAGQPSTNEEAKAFFKANMDNIESLGGFVSNRAEIGNTQFGIFSFINKTNVKVVMNKTFVYKNERVSIDYAVQFNAKDEADAKKESTYHLIAMKLIQKQFDAAKFPFPWEK